MPLILSLLCFGYDIIGFYYNRLIYKYSFPFKAWRYRLYFSVYGRSIIMSRHAPIDPKSSVPGDSARKPGGIGSTQHNVSKDRYDIWDNSDIPVTKLQRLMLSRYESVPNSGLMVIGSFKVPASCIQQAKKSLDDLVKNHPIMRSVCKKVGNDYVLHVNPAKLARYSLIIGDKKEKNNMKFLRETLQKPIELETSAPFRVAAIPVDGDQYLISVSCHYVLCDSTSGEAIIKDFKNSIITGIPVIRKTWLNDFRDPTDSLTREDDADHLSWQMKHIYN